MAAPNAGIGGAALVQQIAAEVNRDEDVLRTQWAQIAGVSDECIVSDNNNSNERTLTCEEFLHLLTFQGHPSYDAYKKAVKVLKDKELWIVGKEMSEEPKKPRVLPAHLVIAMNTTVASLGAGPLITRQQRDDWLSRVMTAKMSYGEEPANVIFGEVIRDVQDVNAETPGTTFIGRFARWMDTEFENKWRTVDRRQKAIEKERKEMAKLPSEADFTNDQFCQAVRDFPHLSSITYGSWWRRDTSTTAKDTEEKKKDE
eukprot:g2549.t1